MKTLCIVVASLVAALLLFVLYARVAGFDPGPTRPGMWLTGELVTDPVADWSFAEKLQPTAIQSRQHFLPALAHSVRTTRFHFKGRLYFGSGYPAGVKLPDGRLWNRNVLADPRVRIRLGTKLFDKKVVYVTDPIERDELLKTIGPMFWSPGFYLHLWRVEPLD
jgi:hypothetical protein